MLCCCEELIFLVCVWRIAIEQVVCYKMLYLGYFNVFGFAFVLFVQLKMKSVIKQIMYYVVRSRVCGELSMSCLWNPNAYGGKEEGGIFEWEMIY